MTAAIVQFAANRNNQPKKKFPDVEDVLEDTLKDALEDALKDTQEDA